METKEVQDCEIYDLMSAICLRENEYIFSLWASEIDFRDRHYAGMGEPIPTPLSVLVSYCDVYDLYLDDFEKLKLIDKTAFIERCKLRDEKRKADEHRKKQKAMNNSSKSARRRR